MAKAVITLVHGTFAVDAAWTKDDSKLCQAIWDAFGDDIRIERFSWSGENDYRARINAGVQLALHLLRQAEADPAAKRIVIAHSHGGNVALYTGKWIPDLSILNGIVCLATPFIVCEAGDIEYLCDKIRARTSWYDLAITVSFSLLYLFLFQALGIPGDSWIAFAGFALIIVSSLALNHWMGRRYLERVIGRDEEATQLLEELSWPALPHTNVLSLVYKGDEAGMLLRTLTQTTEAPHKGYTLSIRLARVLATVGGVALAIFIVTLFLFPESASGISAMVFAWSLVAAMVLSWLGWLFQKIGSATPYLRSHRYGFGKLPRWIHDHISIRAEKQPTGLVAGSVEHRELPPPNEKLVEGYRHNWMYDDPGVLDCIMGWIGALIYEQGADRPAAAELRQNP